MRIAYILPLDKVRVPAVCGNHVQEDSVPPTIMPFHGTKSAAHTKTTTKTETDTTTETHALQAIPVSLTSDCVVAIIHAPSLRTREQHVHKLCAGFKACGVSVVMVTGPEPPMTEPTQLSSLVCMDPGRLTGSQHVLDIFKPLFQDMKVRQLSNALKHVAAIQHIACINPDDIDGASWHLVLEDDAMINDPSAILAACAAAPSDADILFFGLPTSLPHPVNGAIRYDLLEGVKLLPACDAYAVRRRTARFLSPSLLPIRFRTDVHLSWIIATASLTTYLTSPNLSVDGSKIGVYVSTIESNNHLRFNAEYMKLMSSETTMPIADIVSCVSTMPFGAHPDAQVLLGRRLAAAGQHQAAKDVFKAALEVYTTEGGVVGIESVFMSVYLDLFKHDQEMDLLRMPVP